MSSAGTPVMERPQATTFVRPASTQGESLRPWEAGDMPRVPITYKVKGETKREIDLLSATLGLEKTEVVEAAVSELFQRCRSDVEVYLDRMRAAVQGRGTDSLADVLNRKPWPKDYSGRAVEK